jgi:exopolysaccharide biosynthesis polyprenyl glycosylphosphotransferase
MSSKFQRTRYILSDYIAAIASWVLFYSFRKTVLEPAKFGYPVPFEFGETFLLGLILIPLFWILLYFFSGYYKEVFRKSRLSELGNTFFSVLFGVVIIFFFLILDDTVSSYRDYYQSFVFLFLTHFTFTYFLRLGITVYTKSLIQKGKVFFNTLLIGSDQKAYQIFQELHRKRNSSGIRFVGYIKINGSNDFFIDSGLKEIGNIANMDEVIGRYKVDDVIIALETTEHDKIEKIISKLYNPGLNIKAIPAMYDILTGRVRITSILDTPLIQISHTMIPAWQENIKKVFDYTLAFLALLFTSPVNLIIAIIIKLTSKGPVIYSHERIGRYGKPFRIYKFRSMVENAEKTGPELSSETDPRVTTFGRFLRKTKLDELPNFINVLKGEMSIVGPRPERQFYIDQIVERAPYFAHLLKVKPGITSWGQVKYGYAENVEQMVERLRFDLIYLENMSLYVDFKIIIYTIIILFRGRVI